MDPLIVTVLKISSYGFLAGLAIVIAIQLLAGSINTRGLLTDKVTGTFSSGRLQLIIFTCAGAIYFLYHGIQTGGLGDWDNELLVAIGGSSTVYLSGKTFSVFRSITKAHKYLNLLKDKKEG